MKLHINLLKNLADELGSIGYVYKQEKSDQVKKKLQPVFPDLVKINKVKEPKYKVKQALRLLDNQNAQNFEKEDIQKLLNTLGNLLDSKYKNQIKRSELFSTAKLKVDEVTLEEVIKQFEDNLSKNISESRWGKFLGKNLFLIDTKYLHLIPELNVVLAGARKVDFGLIDFQNYLDIFEIKRPNTKLFSKNIDRGNHVWHPETVKALVQAEKYLYQVESKAFTLEKDIKAEKGIDSEVVRPKVYLIIGNLKQLDSSNKKRDFKVLRNQFKNIEIILYDELLERLKNQTNRAI